MNSTAGLAVAVSMCVMMVGLIAHPTRKSPQHCKVLELANYIHTLLTTSLNLYIEKNKDGHLGKSPEDLKIPSEDLPVEQVCDRVRKGLLFMVAALEMVPQLQEGFGHNAQELENKLNGTKDKISSLVECISVTVCTKTTATPAPPPTPTTSAYARKQWGRNVLKFSVRFSTWLTKWLKPRHVLHESSHHR